MAEPAASRDIDCLSEAQKAIAPEVAAARAVAIANSLVETEKLLLAEATGRVVAAAIDTPIAIPPFDNSAMDGYAVRRAELAGEGPWTLRVAGRIAAGGPGVGSPGEGALRIFTGAPVPPGFDAVVMQERARPEDDTVVISGRRPAAGENIRRAGEDVSLGARLLEPSMTLSPQHLALLAGAGVATVEVFRKVRIGIISTGSELRDPGEELLHGQIYNSNRVMLRATLAGLAWADLRDFGIVPDDRRLVEAALSRAAASCDVVVTTGGVSAGDEDHVAAILRDGGASVEVVNVAMRPGKPVKIGQIGHALFAGLPGNPNAALVTFRQIALPAIRAIAGLGDIYPAWQPAISGFAYAKRPGRTEFVPVRVSGRNDRGLPVLEMLGRGSSASLSAMALADGIALLPPHDEAIETGMSLRYEPFRDG